MGTQQEMLCLRWEDFGSHFSSSFKDLRTQNNRDSYFDVSLAVGDHDILIQAHKVILSSCSPFFRKVLAQQSRASPLGGLLHPVIYLRGVSAHHLRNVLDFMYHGEINVAQDDLDDFLAVAEDLKIKGLTQNDGHAEQEANSRGAHGGVGSKRAMPKPDGGGPSKKRASLNQRSQALTVPAAGQQVSRQSMPSASRLHKAEEANAGDVEVVKAEPVGTRDPVAAARVGMEAGASNAVESEDLVEYEDGAGEEDFADEYMDYGNDESGDMSYGDGANLVGHGPVGGGGEGGSSDGGKGRFYSIYA